MPPLLSLARLMAVVIVMIAAAFGASAAQAHAGHTHAGHAHPAAPAARTAGLAPETLGAVTAVVGRTALAIPAGRPAKAEARAEGPAERPCGGVCCAMGPSCCMPGMMVPFPLPALPAPGAAARLIAAAEPLPAGIARETLPRPPRSIA
ncbi:hypothetical protein [Methylobacterium sp. ID0610]|uniref:hypothetical protein n=1 Tax=Methylobacterium carpenticola TaxID=3344827 RepID=UPI0036B36EC3